VLIADGFCVDVAAKIRRMSFAEPQVWLHSAFYRFVPVTDTTGAAQTLRDVAAACAVQGSIVVAHEGVSGAVAGAPEAVQAFEAALHGPAFWGGALSGMAFKHSHGSTRPFARLKVSVKPEIVALGLPDRLPEADALAPPDESDSSHLSPSQWRALLQRDDVVVLDNRNHFEFRLGHFKGAVDPQVHNFRDFVAYVQAHAPAWREAKQPVAMYCTGGIRCDKTAPWLRSLGLQVMQLDGGILNYCQQFPNDSEDWTGECFVFDNRIALDASLQEAATTAEQVFDAQHEDEAWRLQRARRLSDAQE
jgi:UPF0176 protein